MATPWYAVYQIADGTLLSVATVTAAAEELAANGKGRVEIAGPPNEWQVWNRTTHQFDDLPQPKAIMRRSEFWDLFTDAEMEAIRAAPTDGALSIATRRKLNSALGYIADSDEIDLNKPRMQAIITGMETVGLIGNGRAAQIIG